MRTRIIPENNGRVSEEYWIMTLKGWQKAVAQPLTFLGYEHLDLFSVQEGDLFWVSEGLTGMLIGVYGRNDGTRLEGMLSFAERRGEIGKYIADMIGVYGVSPRYGGAP